MKLLRKTLDFFNIHPDRNQRWTLSTLFIVGLLDAYVGPAIKTEQERKAEKERMARREVYLVQMVKVAYIPVYAKDADEARRLADSEAWFDPEDDGDDEWMLGDTVPEVEDLDDMDDCYRHVITRDGIVERDKIYELDQICEEWEKEHKED